MVSNSDYRYDLYLSFCRSEKVYHGREMKSFVKKIREHVIENGHECGGNPSVFDGSGIRHDILSETITALLQTRGGGTVLVLLTPSYFNEPMRCLEFKTLFKENSEEKNTLKPRFYFVDCTRNDFETNTNAAYMLNAYLGSTHIHSIGASNFSHAASEIASDIWKEWKGDYSSEASSLPTICGRTRNLSMNHLARSFTEVVEDLSTFFHCETSRGASAVFHTAIENNRFTFRDVDPLLDFCNTSVAHGRAERIRSVEAYKKKWIATDCLEWGPEKSEELRSEYMKFQTQNYEIGNNSLNHRIQTNVAHQVSPPRLATESQGSVLFYTVRPGDTLYIIAQNKLGDGSRWGEIHELNRDIIPNPDFIVPNMRLKLPH